MTGVQTCLFRSVVDKLLHQPTVRVKELAANSGTVSYETALQELFGLDDDPQSVKVDLDILPDAAELATITKAETLQKQHEPLRQTQGV